MPGKGLCTFSNIVIACSQQVHVESGKVQFKNNNNNKFHMLGFFYYYSYFINQSFHCLERDLRYGYMIKPLSLIFINFSPVFSRWD